LKLLIATNYSSNIVPTELMHCKTGCYKIINAIFNTKMYAYVHWCIKIVQ